jgi:hypothetical protein
VRAPSATIGRVLHYCYSDYDLDEAHKHLVGEIRPAIVVRVWPNEYPGDDTADVLGNGYNVQVFTDGENDGKPSGFFWACSRKITSTSNPVPGTLHWPARS